MQKYIKITTIITRLLVIIIPAGLLVAAYFGYEAFNNKIVNLESRLNQNSDYNKILSAQMRGLGEVMEGIRRQIIKQKSQEQLLTEAVAKAAPAVVSIVVTKDVPELEVVYINPFGDDPFFKNFDIRVPQYRQKGTTEKKVGAGTGFLVNSNGYIITNRHVVSDKDARYTALLSNGKQKAAQVVYIDEEIDVAILKIEGTGYTSIKLGNSDALKLGQSVFAIGNALGEYSNSVSVGIISGLNRDLTAFGGNKTEKLKGVIQTDAAINPGNSGGPLVNLSGQVIGINVAMASAENIGFSIPINVIKPIINAQIK